MFNDKEELKLTDLIDIELLQKLQDAFAKAMGIAIIITDNSGTITEPANFSDFCMNFIRINEAGIKKCNECIIESTKLAMEKREPEIFTCNSGLTNFAVPIIVANQHIASIVGGQVFLKTPDKKYFKKLAEELNIVDEKEYMKALNKIKIVSNDYIKSATDLLFTFEKIISKIASENFELIKRNEREVLYRKITESIRSSLDIQETLSFICEETAKFFNVQRTSISEAVDIEKQVPPVIRMEFKTIPEIEGKDKLMHLSRIGEHYCKILHGNGILAIDNILEADVPNYFKESYIFLGVKSILIIPIHKEDDKWGILILSEYNDYRHWTNEEIELAESIADQIYMAIKHAELYKQEKEALKRENLLREITETIRSSLDINKIKNTIVKEICEAVGADRCFIIEYNKNKDKFLPVQNEYLTSTDLKSSMGFDVNKEAKEMENMNRAGKEVTLTDVDAFLKEHNLLNTPSEKHFRDYGVKSGFSIPILYQNELLGILVIHHTTQKHLFSYEEVELVRTLASQIAIALNQAELYEKEKNISANETALRETIKVIRSSLDVEIIKKNFVRIINKHFKADRCAFIDYDKKSDKFLPIQIEILKEDGIKSLIGIDIQKDVPEFVAKLKNKKRNVIIKDTEKIFLRKKLHNYKALTTVQKNDAKSDYGLLVQYKDEIIGILVLHYIKEVRILTSEEFEFLKILRDQVGIALHQADLYKKEKAVSAKEITLRNTIKIIRSTLDTEKIKNYFLSIVCDYFNADRCLFDDYDKETGNFMPFKTEIIKENGIKSLIDISVENDFPEFADKLKNKKRNIIIKDVEKTLARKNLPNYKAIQTLRNSDAKSDYGFIVQYQDEIIGILILHYIKNKRALTHEDLEFLKILRDQAGIALYQAELFEKTKKQAEREFLLREINEKIRSSLDLEETLSFICEETSKLFNVQRAAITSFPDPENFEIFIVRKEYKHSEEMEGFGPQQESHQTAAYWGKVLIKEGEILAFDNIEESEAPHFFKNTYGSMGIKAIIGTSIKKGKSILGTLVLSEYNNYRHWTKEEKNLLITIADQIYIAINQAELFEKAQKKAQNERILREIMLASVQTFDMPHMIKSLVTEAGKLFEADRCFFIEVDIESNSNLPIQDYAEYLSSENIVSHTTRPPSRDETSNFISRTKQKQYEYSVDVRKEPIPEATKKMLIDDLGVKSYLIAPVFYGDICYGAFVFHYVNNFKLFSQDDFDMAIAVANQSAVILHQAELFEITKIQAEREKISKNIIEILRSTFDKSIITKLFVKNIGKFLDADVVLFSEFDSNENIYKPIDNNSEYLSSPNIKSFVGYDWTCEEAQEYIQPLLEKRELHIYNWHEYIQSNIRSQNFINLFENKGIKSSYSFPVMYQQKIMGFFSINFIKRVHRLNDEDINRIRSICSQAGIALYHANLYIEAQKSVQEHTKFVNRLSGELKEPLDLIIEFSAIKSLHEIECAEEVKHLNLINDNAKKLSYFLEDISKNLKIKLDLN